MTSPEYVNKNRNVSVPLDSYASPGEYLLTAAVPYLAGVRLFRFGLGGQSSSVGFGLNRHRILQSEHHYR